VLCDSGSLLNSWFHRILWVELFSTSPAVHRWEQRPNMVPARFTGLAGALAKARGKPGEPGWNDLLTYHPAVNGWASGKAEGFSCPTKIRWDQEN
jgi:hypothetical protein